MEDEYKNECDKIDEVMLPGFRFHPTDEELEAWAICRIFKKANPTTRPLSHSWVSPLLDTTSTTTNMIDPVNVANDIDQFSCGHNTMIANKSTNHSPLQFGFSCHDIEHSSITSFSPLPFPVSISNGDHPPASYTFSSNETCEVAAGSSSKCGINLDASSLLLEMSNSMLGSSDLGKGSYNVDYSMFGVAHEELLMQGNLGHGSEVEVLLEKGQNNGLGHELVDIIDHHQWETIRSMNMGYFPNIYRSPSDAWKSSSLVWGSSPCPSTEFSSTSFSTNKC
ncbi:hypothetical protein Salat_1299700 [Sesamum alatum]|uniref:NAC domain-containing protein n=1 Tax=Sesamum alatum TaxID=300844 RepID=A0AAE1YGX1_9LAMI|nr:hypothetical protein Salat_1299700 [Sesamum alatum]